MPLFFADGNPFVTGSQSHVFYAPTPAEPKARLVLRVALEGLTTQAMVDTGGLYLFCMPSIARALHLDAAQALGAQTILFRDERVRGALHRLTLTLLAEDGEDMQLDVTAFVPDASYEGVPELPSILGLHGCLERARFAFDPATDTFYFGPASPAV
jgi:hypothetical protein